MSAPPAVDLWQVLGGRAVGTPVGAAEDQDLWDRVAERLNPARARPYLRDGVEAAGCTRACRGIAEFVSFMIETSTSGSFTARAEDPGASLVDTITVPVNVG